ncbi:MAG: hypothetical protein ACLRWP_13715 [Bilophila wadsworthia]
MVAIVLSLFQIYTGGFGVTDAHPARNPPHPHHDPRPAPRPFAQALGEKEGWFPFSSIWR